MNAVKHLDLLSLGALAVSVALALATVVAANAG
jgi:hypothetical protein